MKNLLLELFDSPVPYDIEEESAEYFEASFEVGKMTYLFKASQGEKEWEILFEALEDKREWGVLNTGNAAVVFSTVLRLTKYFLSKYKPEKFFFTAEEKSRNSLYSVAAKGAEKFFPGYKFVDKSTEENKTTYRFEKK
jgi:hypothetical protein